MMPVEAGLTPPNNLGIETPFRLHGTGKLDVPPSVGNRFGVVPFRVRVGSLGVGRSKAVLGWAAARLFYRSERGSRRYSPEREMPDSALQRWPVHLMPSKSSVTAVLRTGLCEWPDRAAPAADVATGLRAVTWTRRAPILGPER
jgi:hypothetical protein